MKKAIVLLASFCLLVTSCGRDYPCIPGEFKIELIGFQKEDINSLIVNKFELNSGFTNSIGALKLDSLNSFIWSENDTIFVHIVDTDFKLNHEFDWSILIESTQQATEVSEILIDKEEYHCGGLFSLECGNYCVSPIVSAKVNGRTEYYKVDDYIITVSK